MASPGQESTLLGVFDGKLDDSKHRSSFLTNKAGGLPDATPGLPRASPRCGRCSAPLVHVVQVYCPLGGSPYHRTLQLFACAAADCGGRPESWAALRSQSLEAEGGAAKEAPLSASDWCDSADDWGAMEEDVAEPVPEEEKAWGTFVDVNVALAFRGRWPPVRPRSGGARTGRSRPASVLHRRAGRAGRRGRDRGGGGGAVARRQAAEGLREAGGSGRRGLRDLREERRASRGPGLLQLPEEDLGVPATDPALLPRRATATDVGPRDAAAAALRSLRRPADLRAAAHAGARRSAELDRRNRDRVAA
ncbi:programmed cell death protein 2-like isoform X2 [Phyllopteryx taeniolatus]|uniref:programmed cell death protein 2-like isoform X2 n=1 Tax=Phyllopteryx taeniolatus TaxID=161469 RepID=UPI002AD2C2E4|nr:programmed cell death protein 2-like isoform X2 [Phyllopteryx taeniolatus]